VTMTPARRSSMPALAVFALALAAMPAAGRAQPLITLCDVAKNPGYYEAEDRLVQVHGTVTKIHSISDEGVMLFDVISPSCAFPVMVEMLARHRCGVGSRITAAGILETELAVVLHVTGTSTWHTCVR